MYTCAAKQSNSCAFLAPTGLSIETSPRFITQGNSYFWTEACGAPYQLLLTQRYEGFIYSFNCFLHHTKHIFPIFTGTIKPDTSHTESPHLQHMWKYISNDIICHSDSVLHIRFKDSVKLWKASTVTRCCCGALCLGTGETRSTAATPDGSQHVFPQWLLLSNTEFLISLS